MHHKNRGFEKWQYTPGNAFSFSVNVDCIILSFVLTFCTMQCERTNK